MIKLGVKIGILIFALALALLYLSMQKRNNEKNFVSANIAGIEITAEIADAPSKRAAGLSGRESLEESAGMLFAFEKSDYHPFWMKDMNFSIDIIWIDENKKIADITKNASPESYPEKFFPARPVKYVLEVNASFTDAHKINIGDSAEF